MKSNSNNAECVNEYVSAHEGSGLSQEEQGKCEGLMTIQECKKAVFSMKTNRSPGMDGMPTEFYIKFSGRI